MSGEKRLTKPEQYACVFQKGKSWGGSEPLVMKAVANELELSRFGLSVSKRVGNAVVRNRVKRRLREILRMANIDSGWDVIFIARPAAAKADYAELKAAVEGLLKRAQILGRGSETAGSGAN